MTRLSGMECQGCTPADAIYVKMTNGLQSLGVTQLEVYAG